MAIGGVIDFTSERGTWSPVFIVWFLASLGKSLESLQKVHKSYTNRHKEEILPQKRQIRFTKGLQGLYWRICSTFW